MTSLIKNNPLILLLFALSTISLTAQIPENAVDISPLLIGENLPNSKLLNDAGVEVELTNILKEKPTVLVFYRGGWCPYCSLQLAAIAEAEAEIIKLGYQIVAISPDHYSQLKPSAEAAKSNYSLYADTNGELLTKVGLAFKTPEQAKSFIEGRTNNTASNILPVPTVMIVDTSGKILFEYINPDYKTRITTELLLSVLNAL